MDYQNFDEPTFDNYLAKFWFGARKDVCEDSQEGDSEDPELKDTGYIKPIHFKVSDMD